MNVDFKSLFYVPNFFKYKIFSSNLNFWIQIVTSLLSPLLPDASVSQGSVGVGE